MKKLIIAIEKLKNGDTGSISLGNDSYLCITPNALLYRNFLKSGSITEFILAVKLENKILGNSSMFYDDVLNLQQNLSQLVSMIPFDMFKQAGLSLKTYEEIKAGPEETIKRKIHNYAMLKSRFDQIKDTCEILEYKKGYKDDVYSVTYLQPEHFTGARLFKVNDKTFLMDLDRKELERGIINPFLVELPKSVETINEAYESLKPAEVVLAERARLKVKRQGEWFFIPTKHKGTPDRELDWQNKTVDKALWLQAGTNRPNRASKCIEVLGLVSGTVSHSGREHEDLVLRGWYKAVPNTATKSWTLTGQID